MGKNLSKFNLKVVTMLLCAFMNGQVRSEGSPAAAPDVVGKGGVNPSKRSAPVAPDNVEEPKENTTTPTLQETITNLNARLPMMIDKETQLEFVNLVEESIFYNYKLVNMKVANMDVKRFKSMMEANLKTSICNGENTRALLNQVKNINYIYRDQDNKPVSKITIQSSDCFK